MGILRTPTNPLDVTGTIKGTGFDVSVTLTVTNGVYSIGDAVGGLITIPGMASAAGKRSVIHTIVLSGVVALEYELYFLPADIVTPAADNAALTMVAADVAQSKGAIKISSSDYLSPTDGFNIATKTGVAYVFSCVATTLYAYLKALAVTSPGTTTITARFIGQFID